MGRNYETNDPSVTEIVDLLDKPGLRYWYGKFGTAYCERVKKESTDIGHRVHKGIEQYLRGKSFSKAAKGLSNQEKLMLSRLVEWVEDEGVEFQSAEESLNSKKYHFNGTYDCTGFIKQGLWLIDWKTDSTPERKEDEQEREFKYKVQIAGYILLLNENRQIDLHRAKVVRISKKQEFKVYTFDDLRYYEDVFLQMRALYKEFKRR